MTKTKLLFASSIESNVANALGYSFLSRMLHKYGDKHFEYTPDADIALTITSADQFNPVAGKVNVLFSMWEFLDLPKCYIESLEKADYIIVPSAFCRDLFKRYTDKPVYVCHLGVEPKEYPYFDRANSYNAFINKQHKFRFLWVGAPNPRKGYPLILEAIKVFEKFDGVEIYLKTTVPKLDLGGTIKSLRKNWLKVISGSFKTPNGKLVSPKDYFSAVIRMFRRMPRPSVADKVTVFGTHKNIFFDTRKLSGEELKELYNSANCFLSPSLGEGWGLCLGEAMSTGCPSIATPVTGHADFFDDRVGYGLKYKVAKQELKNYDLVTDGYVPDTKDLVEKMIYVIQHYQDALKRGSKASERMTQKFTWEQAGNRLHEIMEIIKNDCSVRGLKTSA